MKVTVESTEPVPVMVTGVAVQELLAAVTVPVGLLIAQVKVTFPVNPPFGMTLIVVVLLTVGDSVMTVLRVVLVALSEYGPLVTTETTALAVEVMVPPVGAPVPVTVAVRFPAVPAVVVSVMVDVAVPPEVSVTALGKALHEPAAVPLTLTTAQVTLTVPSKTVDRSEGDDAGVAAGGTGDERQACRRGGRREGRSGEVDCDGRGSDDRCSTGAGDSDRQRAARSRRGVDGECR